MMHLHMVGLALGGAIAIRLFSYLAITQAAQPTANGQSRWQTISWQTRWHRAITAFVAPPLLLLTTAIAIVSMGTNTGHHPWEGQLSYGLSSVFLLLGLLLWCRLGWAAIRTQIAMSRLPEKAIATANCTRLATGKVLNTPTIFSAQVGLWSSGLVISQGLLDHLDDEHLAAVLAHESGHAHYRDTFWFFWLGGLRRLTVWLPYSEALWQELLLLREVRADRWAARSVDTLVLAESLMSVITAPLMPSESVCPGFSCAAPRSRLAQRIDALLEAPITEGFDLSAMQWGALSLSLLPLLTIPFHY